MMGTKKNETRRFVYCGVAEGAKKKLFHVYQDADAFKPGVRVPEDAAWFGKRIAGAYLPGQVTEAEITPDDDGETLTVFPKTGVHRGFHPDADEAVTVAWAAESGAIETAARDERTARKAKPVEEALEPIRVAFRSLKTRPQKAALLVRVVLYIVRGSVL